MPFFSNTVPSDFKDSMRLDKYVASLKDGMNRSKLKSSATEIYVNQKLAKLSSKVKANDVIEIEWDENIPTNIEPENIPLKIIYEDENVTVVNKEQGMVTHPASGNWNGTLVNALLYHWGRSSVVQIFDDDIAKVLENRRPGIVHRLDKDTSGIIITAKNSDSHLWLSEQFYNKFLHKEYILITKGRPPASAGDVKTQIVRDTKDRKKFKAVTDSDAGKYARTLYRVIAYYGNYSLIRVRIKTGRTHQIRVHMKYLGCPILGDPIYGKKDSLFPDATLMLHSRQIDIRLPQQEKFTRFKAAVPERFKQIISELKKNFTKEVPELPKRYLKNND
ncbi:MAG: RluA family pseudouridine synthase [Treponema sp.]|uniref:RluA family pseudouridine synthase n=1 Tax=Treponema sp. TaxID=166 RepID=UPI00298E4FF8|nr:RluA family pseudouridine synthase [Treponema sp.]MBR5934433.1 RluA family pseudouridine synthase [Treponema sp.]